MLIVKMFGLSGTAGLTLAFTRRFRAIFWAAVGGLWLVALSKSRKQSNSDDTTLAAIQVWQEPMPSLEPQKRVRCPDAHTLPLFLRTSGMAVSVSDQQFFRLALFPFCSEPFWEHKKQVLHESSLSSTD